MKLERLQDVLRDNDLDGCLLTSDDPNFRYYVQQYVMSAKLFVPATGAPTIFTHRLEEVDHDFNVVTEDDDTLQEFFTARSLERVGVNLNSLGASSYLAWQDLASLDDIGDELERIRMVKTSQELQYLRQAALVADDIMEGVVENFSFDTEGEIRTYIKTAMSKRGVEQSFEPVVASERAAAVPHYFGDKELREGFLLIDMGVKVNGYCSDITRTFYLGSPSRDERELYEKVRSVQESCIARCQPGQSCSELFSYAKERLGDAFVHGLGHGVGLAIHELPNLKETSEDTFEKDMVVTVEPGYYDRDERVGIRIEDDVLIRGEEPQVLTETPKELMTL
jgi:Xaa-Pro aminopeptidase